jgi:hypothetical protein
MTPATHSYEVRPRKDHRGFDLISDVLPFGHLWYAEPNATSNAVGYAKFFSRSHGALIRVFDESGTVIETYREVDDFKEWWILLAAGCVVLYWMWIVPSTMLPIKL